MPILQLFLHSWVDFYLLPYFPSLVQNDIKKVIALSTCSQLGYMVWGCGFSLYANSYLHLVNHAFLKALLFMSAGSIIHAINEQDLRKLSGIISYLPMSYSCLLIASLSLSGVPFFSGCYSKDHILGLACSQYTIYPYFVFWLATLTACCTAVYSTRLIRLGLAARCSSHHFILRKALNPIPFSYCLFDCWESTLKMLRRTR
jgi:NADH:ubiquinone oxidoreductase subunit 5 (subunit L)/multisubunit Na+/H+ antiporter MnhA subunit